VKSLLKLFVCVLKTYLRDKQAFFWTILFPVMFVILFGLFNFEKMGTSHIAVIDQANSDESLNFIRELKKIEMLKIHQDEEDVAKAKEHLEKGDLDFILIIPNTFKKPTKEQFLEKENHSVVDDIPKGFGTHIECIMMKQIPSSTPLYLEFWINLSPI